MKLPAIGLVKLPAVSTLLVVAAAAWTGWAVLSDRALTAAEAVYKARVAEHFALL